MQEPLQDVVQRIIGEIRSQGDSPESIRKGLSHFVRTDSELTDEESKKDNDHAAYHLIKAVVGGDNLPAFELYKVFYESEKRRYRAQIQTRPMPNNLG